ncbi:hypothetical protein [Methylocucumis oryzae]|uniref:hypothetical protein n=1 Tax=Methylocucumis oryzae TaxID=1632867 RepID=UPI0019552639|nr:hypothetical protein [Methylocucumis oryzae]
MTSPLTKTMVTASSILPWRFVKKTRKNLSKLAIAVAFHDLGIWTNQTCDYLEPSQQLAHDYLVKYGQEDWCDEIAAMIGLHHKIRPYKAKPNWLVEPFRKADWTDVSQGMLKFGLASSTVAEILAHFPNAGFHKRLLALSKQRLQTHPFKPLPMLRF